MLDTAVNLALLAFAASILLVLWRLWVGPEAHDRVLALDTLYTNAMAVLVLGALGSGAGSRSLLFEAALLIALMGFVATVAAARFLAHGDVIE